jgi:hypothetical protein
LPSSQQENEARTALMMHTSVHKLRRKLADKEAYCDEQTRRYFNRLADIMTEQTGILTKIKPNKNNKHAGEVTLRYSSLSEFEGICQRMRIDLSEV